MSDVFNAALIAVVLSVSCVSSAAHDEKKSVTDKTPAIAVLLPCKEFSNPPERPHDPAANFFSFDQLEHYYRVPGEFTHRLTGDQYGFESLSFIITETHPGGGPGLHVHDSEEAHILLEGNAKYQIGEKTISVQGPYVAKVPAGVAHTFVNTGTQTFNLIAVFPSKHPETKRIGPNPLIPSGQGREEPLPCRAQQ
jgi:quercetin dioxygenase-like cupin family protein